LCYTGMRAARAATFFIAGLISEVGECGDNSGQLPAVRSVTGATATG
jgi:hypothetical protein